MVVTAQGNTLQLLTYLLPISRADLILGARWLKTIGPHLTDYDALNMKYLHKGKLAILQGDLDHFRTQAHLHHIKRLVHTKSIAEVYSM